MLLGRLLPAGDICKFNKVHNAWGWSGTSSVADAIPCSSRAGDWLTPTRESVWQLLRQGAQKHAIAVKSHIGGAGALGPPLNGQLLRVVSAAGAGGQHREDSRWQTNGAVDCSGSDHFLDFPPRSGDDNQQNFRQEPPLLRVRLSVHYRVHSRQMLCIGGNQIPFGWSFMSIAKVPMQWGEGDIWTAEFDLPANSKMEYKYVIMEEQDWTTQVSEDSEGVVSFSYRTEPDGPPDVRSIQKQMAIVAWQPGPNRIVNLPCVEEWEGLCEGEVRRRKLRRRQPQQRPLQPYMSGRQYGRQALGGHATRGQQSARGAPGTTQNQQQQQQQEEENESNGSYAPPHPPQQHQPQQARPPEEANPPDGTWETLQLQKDTFLLERRDVWGIPNPPPRRSPMDGLRFDT